MKKFIEEEHTRGGVERESLAARLAEIAFELKQVIRQRQHGLSAVVQIRSEDRIRLDTFLYLAASVLPDQVEVLVYLPVVGVKKVSVREGSLVLEEAKISESPRTTQEQIFRTGRQGRNRRGLREVIEEVEELTPAEIPVSTLSDLLDVLRRRVRGELSVDIFAVLYIPSVESIPESTRQSLLETALYMAEAHDLAESTLTTLVLFTYDSMLPEHVLRKCIVATPPASTRAERRLVVIHLCEKHNAVVSPEDVEAIVRATEGLTLDETYRIVNYVLSSSKGRLDVTEVRRLAQTTTLKSKLIDTETPRGRLDDYVAGYSYLKEYLRKYFIDLYRRRDLCEKFRIRPPRGILLFGPEGTGKSTIARGLAAELGFTLIRLNPGRIFGKFLGETERNLAALMSILNCYEDAILFLDEIDWISSRERLVDADAGVARRVLTMFLEWLGREERKIPVIAATNKPELIDRALIRVGRFDHIIPVLYPDKRSRKEILMFYLRKRPHKLSPEEIEEIASKTRYFHCSELKELVKRACINAITEGRDYVTYRDFEDALTTFNIDVSSREKLKDYYIQLAQMLNVPKSIIEAASNVD